jgi:hypothetical protein
MRWTEELALLAEEHQRALQFFAYVSSLWNQRANDVFSEDSKALAEGRRSYAKRQAAMFLQIRDRCMKSWRDVDKYLARFRETFDGNYKPGSGLVTDTEALLEGMN